MPQPRHQVQDSSLARTCPRPRPRHLSSHPSLNGQLQRQVTTSLDDDRQKAPTPSSPRSVQWIASRCHSRGETRGTGTRQARRCRPRGRAGRVGPRAPNPFFSFPVPPTLHPPFLRPPAARRALHDIKPQPSIRIPQCKSPGRRQAPPPPPGTSRCGMGGTLTCVFWWKICRRVFRQFLCPFWVGRCRDWDASYSRFRVWGSAR